MAARLRAFLGAGVLAALAAAGAASLLYRLGVWSFNDPSRARFPTRGADVSHHQGAIDWTRAAPGLSFAYLKASEGGDRRDERFVENWRGATGAGLRAGAYHFFTFCRDGASQAENLLGMLAQVEGPMLPPAVDLEFKGNCARRPPAAELRAELARFDALVRARTGLPVVYYVTRSFVRAYGDVAPPGAPLWTRDVLREPGPLFGRRWTFWQWAENRRLPGVSGPVDLDVFEGGPDAWRAFGAPAPARPSPRR